MWAEVHTPILYLDDLPVCMLDQLVLANNQPVCKLEEVFWVYMISTIGCGAAIRSALITFTTRGTLYVYSCVSVLQGIS